MANKEENTDALQTYNILGKGTSVKGELQTAGNLRIDGDFTGNLTLGGKLVVGESGSVNGNITCANADIEGRVKIDKMTVNGLLNLKKTAVLEGTVTIQKIGIEQGAHFTGTCTMPKERA